MVSVLVVAETRPEAIKSTPISGGLDGLGDDYALIWSGKHYDYGLAAYSLRSLVLGSPV